MMRVEHIGPHALYLGDCLEIIPTLPPPNHIIGDPPYEDELHAAVGKINRIRNDGRRVPDDLTFTGINALRKDIAAVCVKASSGWLILFTLAEGVRAWRDDIQAAKGKWDTVLVWVKPDSAPRFNGQGAARGFENAVTAWCGKGYRSWNGGGKRGIYQFNTNGGTRHGQHPTEKPVYLMRAIVGDFTNRGQTVMDPFMGSGTTGVACAAMGRNFIGIETQERWFDIACQRIAWAHENQDMFAAVSSAEMVGFDLEKGE